MARNGHCGRYATSWWIEAVSLAHGRRSGERLSGHGGVYACVAPAIRSPPGADGMEPTAGRCDGERGVAPSCVDESRIVPALPRDDPPARRLRERSVRY